MHVPLDWLFGTYAGCKEEVNATFLHFHFHLFKFEFFDSTPFLVKVHITKFLSQVSKVWHGSIIFNNNFQGTFLSQVSKIWHGQKSGEEANETAVHAASAKAGKVE